VVDHQARQAVAWISEGLIGDAEVFEQVFLASLTRLTLQAVQLERGFTVRCP
jgi:hypothetical protein